MLFTITQNTTMTAFDIPLLCDSVVARSMAMSEFC